MEALSKRHEVHIIYKPDGETREYEHHVVPFSNRDVARTFADRQRKREDVHSVEIKEGFEKCQINK